ncbi:MAG: response regulator [Treponema sp.]|jgi:two-component system response regulator YesN|nr:response regulator [Treponema sp.]
MYRVLIVDDEEPVLESYEFMLKGTEDFVLAGKARSGYEALKLMYEAAPDVVFMDINIPGMDGLAVIAEVHEKFSSTVFILSTAYERFDLAQRAIPLGVFEYLVKPVSRKTFTATLDKVRNHLDSLGKEQAGGPENSGQGNRAFFREGLLREMTEAAWERFREDFSLPSDKGIVCAAEISGETLDGDEDKAWGKALGEKLSRKYLTLSDIRRNRAVFFISGEADRETLAGILKTAGEEPAPEPLWGIGGLYRGPELYRSREEALAELGTKRREADIDVRERLGIARLRRRIGIDGDEEIRKLFTGLREDIFSSRNFDRAKALMAGIFMLLLDDLRGSWGAYPEEPPLFNPVEEIMALEDSAAWEAWVPETFAKVQKEFSLRRSGNFPLPLVKAITFIREHYAETVQLGSAAEAAQVTPAYLSRLFSEYLKTNFIDYLTELRLEKGEKLIRESGKSIKEIAYAVGYQDPNYFSKIFKKFRGLSPTEFGEEIHKAK